VVLNVEIILLFSNEKTAKIAIGSNVALNDKIKFSHEDAIIFLTKNHL